MDRVGAALMGAGVLLGGSGGLFIPTGAVEAYVLLNCHEPDVTATYIDAWYEWGEALQGPSLWRTAWEAAISDWSQAGTTKDLGLWHFPGSPRP